jgi:hypothetical protein
MLKRTATYLLALTIALAATLQVIASASVSADQPAMPMATMDMSGDCDNPAPPCKGMTPACIVSMGCLMIVAVPAAPLAASVPFKWGTVSYASSVAPLDGVSIEPELFPPILRA